MKTLAAVLVGVVIAVGTIGAFALTNAGGGEDAALAAVPVDATLYATAYLQPSLSQARAVGELLERFDVPRQQIDQALSQTVEPLAEVGLEYERDIQPWLGNQVAVFALPAAGADAAPDGAALFATTDIAATRRAVDRVLATAGGSPAEVRSHAGVEYQVVNTGTEVAVGYVNDFVVVGTVRAFTASVDATTTQGLAARPEYAQTATTLPGDNLLLVWFDPEALSGLPGVDGSAATGLAQQQPTVTVLRMDGGALVVETATLIDPEAPPPLEFSTPDVLADLPSDAIAAVGIPALGEAAIRFLDTFADVPGTEGARAAEEGFETQTGLSLRNDVLRWMGDAALFVSGTTPDAIIGGLTVASSDAAATARVVETMRLQVGSVGLEPSPVELEGLTGFSVQEGAPAPISVLGGNRFVVGYGAGAVEPLLAPAQRLADSETYVAADSALGGDWMPTLFIDVGAARTLGEAAAGGAAALGPTYANDVAPRLEQVRAVIAGTRRVDNTTRQRLAVLFAGN